MRLASFTDSTTDPVGRLRLGVIEGDEIVDLTDPAVDLPADLTALLALGKSGLVQAREAPTSTAARHSLSSVIVAITGDRAAGHPGHRHELPGPRGGNGSGGAGVPVLVQQAANLHCRTR